MESSSIRPVHRLTRMFLRYSLAVSFILACASQFKWYEVVQITPFGLFGIASDQYGAVLMFRAYEPGMRFFNYSGSGTYAFPNDHPSKYSRKHFSVDEWYRKAVLLPGFACWVSLPNVVVGDIHAIFIDHIWIIAVTTCLNVAAHWNVVRRHIGTIGLKTQSDS